MHWKGISLWSLVPKYSTLLHLPLNTANVKDNKRHQPILDVPWRSSSCTIRHYVQAVPCPKGCTKIAKSITKRYCMVARCWHLWDWQWQVLAEIVTAGIRSHTSRWVAREFLLWNNQRLNKPWRNPSISQYKHTLMRPPPRMGDYCHKVLIAVHIW